MTHHMTEENTESTAMTAVVENLMAMDVMREFGGGAEGYRSRLGR